MKEIDDIDFRNKLKEQSPQPQYDEWFTNRVMKRLPGKEPNYKWIQCLLYVLGGVICGFFWKDFVGSLNLAAITLGEILKYAALTGVSFALLWQTLRATILTD